MIRLFKVKEQQKEEAGKTGGRPNGKKQTAGELRLHKGHYNKKNLSLLRIKVFLLLLEVHFLKVMCNINMFC